MTRVMGRSVARLLAVLVIAGSLTLVGHPARACSCADAPVTELLPSADGAFVGTFVGREESSDQRALFTFDVERVVKGEFGPVAVVESNAYGASCGLEFLDGPRRGLLLSRETDGTWTSSLCSMVSPSELRAVGGGHPPDPSVGPTGGLTNEAPLFWWVLLGTLVAAAAVLALRRWAWGPDMGRREGGVA